VWAGFAVVEVEQLEQKVLYEDACYDAKYQYKQAKNQVIQF
jgi:hypothetical protein